MSERALKLEVRQVGQAAVVHLAGSADIAEAERMRLRLEDLASRRISLIVLDLADMDFICSSGLGAIISAHIKCRHHQGKIRLAAPQPAVRELLETTCLDKILPIYKGVEQALAS